MSLGQAPDDSRELALPADPLAARRARDFTTEVLAGWRAAPLVVEDAELLVSELVTNAVLHTRSGPELRVTRHERRLRVEVTDASAEPPRLRHHHVTAATGRGLLLVARLAADWGFEPLDGRGKRVWFELDLGPPEPDLVP